MSGGIGRNATDKLSDAKIRAFIAKSRAGRAETKKLSDGGGLHLKVTPTGAAVWRIKYRYHGKEQLYAGMGAYPEVTLERARTERDKVRELLREGRDPMAFRRVSKAETASASGNTFQDVVQDWLEKRKKKWSGVHYENSKRALEKDVLPSLGKLPVGEITPAMVTPVIETILKRDAVDTAGKVLQHVNGIFRLALAKGLCRENPAAPVREVLPKKATPKPRPAFLKFAELGNVLRSAEAARLSPTVRLAHRLLAFAPVRISNVIGAEWEEFELDAEQPTWIIPRRKMKARDRHHDHKVILGPTIAAELRAWRQTIGGKGHVFPSPVRGKHITPESLEKAYRVTLGLEDKHTPHGWRAAFSTLARENGFERDAVELALDHIHDNEVVRAYDRGERLEQRVKLMQWWDAQLAQAQRGADVKLLKREHVA